MFKKLVKHEDIDLHATDLLGLTPTDWILLGKRKRLAPMVADYSSGSSLNPLHVAVAEENLDRVRALIEAGANVNAKVPGKVGLTPLIISLIHKGKIFSTFAKPCSLLYIHNENK